MIEQHAERTAGQSETSRSFRFLHDKIGEWTSAAARSPERKSAILAELVKRVGLWITRARLLCPEAAKITKPADKIETFSKIGTCFIEVLNRNPELTDVVFENYLRITERRDSQDGLSPAQWYAVMKAAAVQKLLQAFGFFEYLPSLQAGEDNTQTFAMYYDVLMQVVVGTITRDRNRLVARERAPVSAPQAAVMEPVQHAWAAATQAWKSPTPPAGGGESAVVAGRRFNGTPPRDISLDGAGFDDKTIFAAPVPYDPNQVDFSRNDLWKRIWETLKKPLPPPSRWFRP